MKESRACRAFWRFHAKQGHRYERKQPLTEHKVSQKAGPHMWQIGSHRRRGHTYWTKARSHRKQGLTEGKISQKVWSHIWKKTGSRESLTEGKLWQRAGRVSQKAKSHRRPGLTEGKVSQVEGSTCFRVSRKQGSYRRQGLTEGKVSQKGRCVTDGRVWQKASLK